MCFEIGWLSSQAGGKVEAKRWFGLFRGYVPLSPCSVGVILEVGVGSVTPWTPIWSYTDNLSPPPLLSTTCYNVPSSSSLNTDVPMQASPAHEAAGERSLEVVPSEGGPEPDDIGHAESGPRRVGGRKQGRTVDGHD